MVTHYIEEISELVTKCNLVTFENKEDDASFDLSECTCTRCLSLVINDLNKRLNDVTEQNMLKSQECSRVVCTPVYTRKLRKIHIDQKVASTPVYMTKSPDTGKKQK